MNDFQFEDESRYHPEHFWHIQQRHQNNRCYRIFSYREFHIQVRFSNGDDFLRLNSDKDRHFEDIYRDF